MAIDSQILIVEDEPDTAELLGDSLSSDGHAVTLAHDLTEAIARLEERNYDVVLTDLQLEGESGMDLCRHIADQHPDLPVILVTAHGSVQTAVEALRAGAFDFITKPLDLSQLKHRVQRALSHRELLIEVKRLRRVSQDPDGFASIMGSSPPMRRMFGMISRLGGSDISVLITGESGAGKELVARALHQQSAHADGPFVAINCAAVPPTLIESELFGHAKGAFTDAKRARDGLFVKANGGTLFLDEIGELPPAMQPKLLRALQERKVTPVGGNEEIPFQARIVSATNRDLEEEVERGSFREDLFYRVNVVGLHVPPLRARGTDILHLARHFLNQAAERARRNVTGISRIAAQKLMAYDWPGNVRELQNAMERSVALTREREIQLRDLPDRVRSFRPSEMVVGGSDPAEMISLDELENRYILKVLETVNGNKTVAAEVLGVGRRTLYRRLDRIETMQRTLSMSVRPH